MKHEFENTLKGDDIQLSSKPIEDGEEITNIECKIKWSIEPQVETWGIRYWRPVMNSFEYTITIQGEQERKTIIPSVCMYECEINDDQYKMKDDFMITRIEIDREKEKATAFIQS